MQLGQRELLRPCKKCFFEPDLSHLVEHAEDGERFRQFVYGEPSRTVVRILIFSSHWPTRKYAEIITRDIKFSFQSFEVYVPQLHNCQNEALKTRTNSVLNSNAHLFGNNDRREHPEDVKTRPAIHLFFLQHHTMFSAYSRKQGRSSNDWGCPKHISRSRDSTIVRGRIQFADTASTLKTQPGSEESVQLACGIANNLLTKFISFEHRMRLNLDVFDALQLLILLFDVHLLLKKNGDEEYENQMQLTISLSRDGCDASGLRDVSDSDQDGAIYLWEIKGLLEYWLQVRPDGCMEWLFQRSLESLAYGDVIPAVSMHVHRERNLSSVEVFGPRLPKSTEGISPAHTSQHMHDSNASNSKRSLPLIRPTFANVKELALRCCEAISEGSVHQMFNIYGLPVSTFSNDSLVDDGFKRNIAEDEVNMETC